MDSTTAKARIDNDLRRLAPEWVAYCEERAQKVNDGELLIKDAMCDLMRFAIRGITKTCVDYIKAELWPRFLYEERRRIVRLLNRRIRSAAEKGIIT